MQKYCAARCATSSKSMAMLLHYEYVGDLERCDKSSRMCRQLSLVVRPMPGGSVRELSKNYFCEKMNLGKKPAGSHLVVLVSILPFLWSTCTVPRILR